MQVYSPIFFTKERGSRGRRGARAVGEPSPVSNGAVSLAVAPALHHLQVGLHLVQVLLEAGEQAVVLQQGVLVAQVDVEFVVGGFEDLGTPRAPVLQLLREEGDVLGMSILHGVPSPALPSSSRGGWGVFSTPP